MNFKFRVFRATDDIASCKIFKDGHDQVLKEYKVYYHDKDNLNWMHNPNVYCLIAESPAENKIIGGLKIQVADDNYQLPLEMAIGKMNKMISKVLENYRRSGGLAECSALWHSRSVAGSGISTLLLRSAISLFKQVQVNTLLALCTDYTLSKFYQAGFREMDQLAGQSNYPYPTEFYSAKLLGISDPQILKNARSHDRNRIESLVNAPFQNFIEFEEGKEIKIAYDLLIK